MSALLEPYKVKKPTGSDLRMLQGDSQLVIVTGRSVTTPLPLKGHLHFDALTNHSDTTASTLTNLFYQLERNPRHISKLRVEIAPHMSPEGDFPNLKLQYLQHLNAVINETLRLHPPVSTALQRKTPSGGIEIGTMYVPGGTTVWCPQYVISRSKFSNIRTPKLQLNTICR